MTKRLTAAVSALLLLVVNLCGCGGEDDGSNYIFKYDITANPTTLDPQTADDENSSLLIDCIFDGLLECDSDGNPVGAVAKSYEVSENGLIYTFFLRDDVYWTDGDEFEAQCTANDFVFAFRRLFNPATKSPRASDFYCIKNGKNLIIKATTDFTKLGVRAIDDFTLEIKLDYPNPNFPVLLTTTPAKPCNEEFFLSTEGRYGLDKDCIASNGAFYLNSWSYDKWSSDNNNLILRRNAKNSESNRIYPYGLNFFIDEIDPLKNFYDNHSHSIVANGDTAVELLEKGYNYAESANSTWGIMFNMSSVFKSKQLRVALAKAIDRTTVNIDATGYSFTSDLIPAGIVLGESSYREQTGSGFAFKYDRSGGEKAYEAALSEMDAHELNGLSLIVPENAVMYDYLGYITQEWQARYGFYCNIKTLSDSEYKAALESGDYAFALVKLTGSFNSPSAYLGQFGSVSNYSGYKNDKFTDYLTEAERSASIEDSLSNYKKAEKLLINDAVFVPICSQTDYFFLNENCYDIIYNPFTKTINYRNAKYMENRKDDKS